MQISYLRQSSRIVIKGGVPPTSPISPASSGAPIAPISRLSDSVKTASSHMLIVLPPQEDSSSGSEIILCRANQDSGVSRFIGNAFECTAGGIRYYLIYANDNLLDVDSNRIILSGIRDCALTITCFGRFAIFSFVHTAHARSEIKGAGDKSFIYNYDLNKATMLPMPITAVYGGNEFIVVAAEGIFDIAHMQHIPLPVSKRFIGLCGKQIIFSEPDSKGVAIIQYTCASTPVIQINTFCLGCRIATKRTIPLACSKHRAPICPGCSLVVCRRCA